MKLLDKYTLRGFISYAIWSLLAFLVLFYVIDIVENMDRFIDRGAHLTDVLLYYLAYTPYIIILVSPIALLLSANFACGAMARHREIIAIRSGGISSLRAGAPLMIFGLLWSIFVMLFGEIAVPKTNEMRDTIKRERIDKKRRRINRVKNLLYQGEDGNIYSIGSLDPRRQKASNILIVSFGHDDRVERMIRAREARYEQRKWTLYDGHIYGFEGDSACEYSSFVKRTLQLRESPAELAERRANPDEMGFFALRKFIKRVERAGGEPLRERTDLFMKLSYPFINFIILLFGVPLALRVQRSGVAMGFAQSAAIAFIYFGAIRVGQVLGYNGVLPPLLAATVGNIIFGSAGVILLFSLRG